MTVVEVAKLCRRDKCVSKWRIRVEVTTFEGLKGVPLCRSEGFWLLGYRKLSLSSLFYFICWISIKKHINRIQIELQDEIDGGESLHLEEPEKSTGAWYTDWCYTMRILKIFIRFFFLAFDPIKISQIVKKRS